MVAREPAHLLAENRADHRDEHDCLVDFDLTRDFIDILVPVRGPPGANELDAHVGRGFAEPGQYLPLSGRLNLIATDKQDAHGLPDNSVLHRRALRLFAPLHRGEVCSLFGSGPSLKPVRIQRQQ